ncbi:MAG: N-acetyltransferase [Candidatus Thermoplasmatota archaeon]
MATHDDLGPLYDIETECFQERRFRKDHVEWILTNERALTLVEEAERGEILGALMLLFEGTACRVLSIAVIPQARRRGIATRMMQAAEDSARERGCMVVRLEVSTQNFGAIEFYRGLGYHTDGVLYGYYSWGEDAYSMARAVAPKIDSGRGDGRRRA